MRDFLLGFAAGNVLIALEPDKTSPDREETADQSSRFERAHARMGARWAQPSARGHLFFELKVCMQSNVFVSAFFG